LTLRTLISVGEGSSGPTSGFSILTLVRVKTENSFFANFEGETSKGDGVIVVPSIIRREGSQETVFNKDRTSIGKTIHSTHLLRTKTFDYNSMLATHSNINTESIRRMSTQVFPKCNINPETHSELAATQGIRYISSKPALTCVGESSTPASLRTKKSLNP
jgi:hypothetical protein